MSEESINRTITGTKKPGLPSNARLRVLVFLARFHCALGWQIARSLCDHDLSLARKKLAEVKHLLSALELRGWIARLDNVPLPKVYGSATVTVYFLEKPGLETLQRLAPKHAERARFGRPRGEMLRRLGHDLHITEAICHISKNCRVTKFIDEDSLKSSLGVKKGSAIGPVEDFQVTVIKRGELEEKKQLYRCEVIIAGKAEQIKNKPEHVIFFVCDKKQIDRIKQIRGRTTRVRLLNLLPPDLQLKEGNSKTLVPLSSKSNTHGGPRRESYRRPMRRSDGTLRPLPARVLRALSLVGAADSSALAAMVNHDRTGVSRCLAALAGDLVRRESVFLRAISIDGAPRILYVPINAPEMDWDLRLHFLMVSRVIVEARRLGYFFETYDRSKGILTLIPERSGLESVWIVVDNPGLTLRRLHERYEAARYFAEKNKGQVLVAITDDARLAAFKNMIPHDELYDFYN